MSNQIVSWHENAQILMPAQPNKDQSSRLGFYLDWLSQTRRAWSQPDLAAYRDYLLYRREKRNPRSGEIVIAPLAPQTVKAHLATIRSRYDALLRDNRIRQRLYDMAPAGASAADKKAFVDEALVRLQNTIHPSAAVVDTVTIQDHAEGEHLRLKAHQVKSLLRAPGIDTLAGLRDSAMIAVMACTGIREAELVALRVDDLRQALGGELALRIRHGKGNKQRLVPYGPLDWCLVYVDAWMKAAQITAGPVFRGIYKGGKRVRKSAISERSVNRILLGYPITIGGDLRTVQPHDLRRTYARNAYEHGMDMERIRQNLGHSSVQTTQGYIGELDADLRRPPAMFSPAHDLRTLRDRVWQQGE